VKFAWQVQDCITSVDLALGLCPGLEYAYPFLLSNAHISFGIGGAGQEEPEKEGSIKYLPITPADSI
jgi:hypothetical protein